MKVDTQASSDMSVPSQLAQQQTLEQQLTAVAEPLIQSQQQLQQQVQQQGQHQAQQQAQQQGFTTAAGHPRRRWRRPRISDPSKFPRQRRR